MQKARSWHTDRDMVPFDPALATSANLLQELEATNASGVTFGSRQNKSPPSPLLGAFHATPHSTQCTSKYRQSHIGTLVRYLLVTSPYPLTSLGWPQDPKPKLRRPHVQQSSQCRSNTETHRCNPAPPQHKRNQIKAHPYPSLHSGNNNESEEWVHRWHGSPLPMLTPHSRCAPSL